MTCMTITCLESNDFYYLLQVETKNPKKERRCSTLSHMTHIEGFEDVDFPPPLFHESRGGGQSTRRGEEKLLGGSRV